MDKAELQQAAAFLRRRQAARRVANVGRLQRARVDFDAITSMLVCKYRPRRVYQWGSLIDGHGFSDISDIDIAVEGLGSAETYFALIGDAMRMTEFPLDLVELEKIEPLHAESIRRHGRLVYERKD